MHSQQPPGVVQNWSRLQCSKQNTEQCGYDHAPVTRGRMRAQFPLPHGPHVLAFTLLPTCFQVGGIGSQGLSLSTVKPFTATACWVHMLSFVSA